MKLSGWHAEDKEGVSKQLVGNLLGETREKGWGRSGLREEVD